MSVDDRDAGKCQCGNETQGENQIQSLIQGRGRAISKSSKTSKNSVLQIANLRAKLDVAWLECIGCPVIYTWRQLLQDEALSVAVENGKLDLSELHEKAVRERKAVIEAAKKSTPVKQECSAASVESRLIDDDDGDEENPYNGHRPQRKSGGAQGQVSWKAFTPSAHFWSRLQFGGLRFRVHVWRFAE